MNEEQTLRACLREPIPQIADAARYLDAAVSAHLAGQSDSADALIRLANMPAIRDWTESLWGSNSSYVLYRPVPDAPPSIPKHQRVEWRMPTATEKRRLHQRDGFHCRFCGIPLIRMEVRKRIRSAYPKALPWGRTNVTQHAAFQAMWLQYDHLLPHARGGSNDLENMLLTCAPCNYGRRDRILQEVGLIDPRTRAILCSSWDGLERFPNQSRDRALYPA
ncbi:MAG: HNH endonuclease [Myxacorys californica WJT36-NPBG1]|nr:HNH endonuclease [Myxacorys californica WJT36-NPBG1]